MFAVAVIVAGGSGSRMGAQVPKQFLPLAGKPVLQHTIERFAASEVFQHAVLVLPADQIDHAIAHCALRPLLDKGWLHTVAGGESRTHSVSNGLSLATELSDKQDDAVVAIHDGVRPFATVNMLRESCETALRAGSGVCAVPVKSSIREQLADGSSRSVERSRYFHVQTPQAFQLHRLRDAYAQLNAGAVVSDDATVFEMAGQCITLVDGSYDNLKLTTPEDLLIAEQILKRSLGAGK